MSHHSPLLHLHILLIFSLLPALPSLPVLPNPSNPNPNPVQSFHPNPSQPITIPSFPEQSALSGCPLNLPDPLFPAVKSSAPNSDAESDNELRKTTSLEMPDLPDDSETCVDALENVMKDKGLNLDDVIPTFADSPPKIGGKELASESYLSRLFSLQSIASLSGCCQEQGDVVSVSKSTSNAISQETSADIAKEKGNQAFKDKQWAKAISFYTEAIKLNGNNATYYSNRAAAYLELGSFVQAEADCTNAINLDKKNVKAYVHRGTAREMLSYYKEAIEDFRYALVLEPTNKRAAVSVERLKNLFQ